MRVLLLGSSGMVGQGALRELLLDPAITQVTTLVRKASGQQHPKLRELVHGDLLQLAGLELACEVCIFAVGVSSAGLSEEAYSKVTYEMALAAAQAVLSPSTTFIYVSGAGADGDSMWARVKRRAEQALLAMPFKSVYVFRPGFIRPLHGIRSRTALYNVLYALLWPFTFLIPSRFATTTERIGRAMIRVARAGYEKKTLESDDINRAALS